MTSISRSAQGRGPIDTSSEYSIQLDHKVLSAIGLGSLEPNTKADLIIAFNKEFEHRVGDSMLDHLTSGQFEEVSQLIDADDVVAALRCLESHGIDRAQILWHHFDALVNELRVNAQHILSVVSLTSERHQDR